MFDVWVIFDHPADFPEHYVVAVQRATGDSVVEHLPGRWLCASLHEARFVVATNHPGAVRLERDSLDDPVIVETWV